MSVVVAMTVTMASTASADLLTSESSPGTLTGKQETKLLLKTTAGSSECLSVTSSGTGSSPTATVTMSSSYSSCTCFGVACTIDMNGCDHLLHLGASTTATVDIVCPVGQRVTITNSKCTLHIGPQAGLGKVGISNVGAGTTREILLATEITGLHYSHTEGTGIGKCTSGTGATGTLTGSIRVTGERSFGEHMGIFAS